MAVIGSDPNDERRKISLYAHDLDAFTRMEKLLAVLKESTVEGEVTFLDSTGSHTVGVLWYDSDEDEWRIDLSKYGEG